jgi:hypothetical protein
VWAERGIYEFVGIPGFDGGLKVRHQKFLSLILFKKMFNLFIFGCKAFPVLGYRL